MAEEVLESLECEHGFMKPPHPPPMMLRPSVSIAPMPTTPRLPMSIAPTPTTTSGY
jgi:hypothetical protein